MIKNSRKLQKFNDKIIREEALSYPQALRIYEGLYREAVHLKAIHADNILQGIETDIALAKALNSLK